MDYNRHAVSDACATTNGYEASYNIILNHLGDGYSSAHVFDTHDSGTASGNKYNIHHNTFYDSPYLGNQWAVGIRGTPLVNANISYNDFRCTTYAYWPGSQNAPPVFQLDDNGLGNVTMTNNLMDGVYHSVGTIRLRTGEGTDWW